MILQVPEIFSPKQIPLRLPRQTHQIHCAWALRLVIHYTFSLFQDPLHKEFCIPKLNHQVINQQLVPWREEPSFHEVVAFAEIYMSANLDTAL